MKVGKGEWGKMKVKSGFYHRDSEAQSASFVHLPALRLSALVPLC